MLRKFACVAAVLAGVLSACAQAPGVVDATGATYVTPVEQAKANASAYVLRPNDQVRVRVYNEPEISGEYQVDGRGQLSIPLAGAIRAEGLTTTQLEQAIRSRLERGIIRDPRVSAQVLTYGPFYIHGEVKRSGEYAARPGLTAMDAVAVAGGFTYRADESKVFIRRAGTAREQAYPASTSVPILPGDNIRIAERFF